MAVSSSNISMNLGWSMSESVTGFSARTQGPDSNTFMILPGTAAYNILYSAQHTIASNGGLVTINFNAFTDLLNTSVTSTKVLAIMIQTTGNKIKLSPGAADPLVWFFGGATESITIQAGGAMVFYNGDVSSAVSNTVKNLLLTNTGATGTPNSIVKVTILGGT